jgi:pyrimidine operon attenuation protein/uracil phosphoribosyltransferase
MKILNETQIKQKIKRLAFEILEQNYNEEKIILAGINKNGMNFARLLVRELKKIAIVPVELSSVKINPAAPLAEEIKFEYPIDDLDGKVVIIIDDVANTGRTIFYATKPLLEVVPKRIEAAVLVDRQHKSFPIRVDYVGISLATTLMEDIDVQIKNVDEMAVYLR